MDGIIIISDLAKFMFVYVEENNNKGRRISVKSFFKTCDLFLTNKKLTKALGLHRLTARLFLSDLGAPCRSG